MDVSELLDFKRGVSHRRGDNDGTEPTMGDSAELRCCSNKTHARQSDSLSN